jgi:hypothetical protein
VVFVWPNKDERVITRARSIMKSAVCTPADSPMKESYISPDNNAETAVTIATPQKAVSAHGADIFTTPERRIDKLKNIQATQTPTITSNVLVYPNGAYIAGIKNNGSMPNIITIIFCATARNDTSIESTVSGTGIPWNCSCIENTSYSNKYMYSLAYI